MPRFLHRLEEGILAFLLALMVIVTFAQVVMRYIFGTGLLWGQEVTLYAFAWLVVFGLSYGIRTRAHLGIDIVVKMLATPKRRAIGLVAIAACVAYAALMAYGAYVYVETLHSVGIEAEDIPLERWILSAIMPIGFALLGFRLLYEAVRILRGDAHEFELADEAKDVLIEAGAVPPEAPR